MVGDDDLLYFHHINFKQSIKEKSNISELRNKVMALTSQSGGYINTFLSHICTISLLRGQRKKIRDFEICFHIHALKIFPAINRCVLQYPFVYFCIYECLTFHLIPASYRMCGIQFSLFSNLSTCICLYSCLSLNTHCGHTRRCTLNVSTLYVYSANYKHLF